MRANKPLLRAPPEAVMESKSFWSEELEQHLAYQYTFTSGQSHRGSYSIQKDEKKEGIFKKKTSFPEVPHKNDANSDAKSTNLCVFVALTHMWAV